MIIGKVNADYEPIIRVEIHGFNGRIDERDAVKVKKKLLCQ